MKVCHSTEIVTWIDIVVLVDFAVPADENERQYSVHSLAVLL
jgi:hypothetical protein